MSEPIERVLLSPRTEAERLWSVAQDALQKSRQSVAHLCESVELGMRVVEILTIQHMRQVRKEFPASVTILLDPPPPDVDPERDFVNPPRSLRFVDALDMLSARDLSCISPLLHHGWVDHAELCRSLRASTRRATGLSVDKPQRDALMVLGAYRNRIFLLPPPVQIVPDDVLQAFPVLTALVAQLLAMEPTLATG